MSLIVNEHYVIDKYPTYCGGCPFHLNHTYKDNGCTGTYSSCRLGYMNHKDTREYNPNYMFGECHIVDDSRVSVSGSPNITKEECNSIHICPDCNVPLEGLVISYNGGVEVNVTKEFEPYSPIYWMYVCPKCSKVYCFKVEEVDL